MTLEKPDRAARRTVIGFDSAWTDNPTAPGAVCVLRSATIGWDLEPPKLTSFAQALAIIEAEQVSSDYCLVAVDQPTIVPNLTGSRPVDKVAASLISFVGGGVQPANRSKHRMFDDAAPIWKFKAALGATEDPEQARLASKGLFIMEVFPALALPTFEPTLHGRHAAARYNPANRRRFRHEDWLTVISCVSRLGELHQIDGIASWCQVHRHIPVPRKGDQDLLDAVLCALVGVHWLVADRTRSVMIGDLEKGYMIAPASAEVRARLSAAAAKRDVPIN